MIQTLRGYGIECLEDILLPEDPNKEGKTKGFAFLEFNSHSDAMEAFQRLRKPDAIFGCERSAKVAFAETSMNLSEEIMLQVCWNFFLSPNTVSQNYQNALIFLWCRMDD